MRDCSISTANALEILQSCMKPSNWSWTTVLHKAVNIISCQYHYALKQSNFLITLPFLSQIFTKQTPYLTHEGKIRRCLLNVYSLICILCFSLSYHINGLVQDCSNSIALAMELLQSCTDPLNVACYCRLCVLRRLDDTQSILTSRSVQ